MEIRVLRYFVEAARQASITRAAEALHVSQPTLSKQLKGLENEIGKQLFQRDNYGIKLTTAGTLMRKRAEDILAMVDKTSAEFSAMTTLTGGNLYIGCAESQSIRYLAASVSTFRQRYPDLRFHLVSGDTELVTDKLDQGLADLAIIAEPPRLDHYTYLEIPGADTWGVVMRQEDPLSQKEVITPTDLKHQAIICSEQAIKNDIPRWAGDEVFNLNLIGTTNLVFNGSVFVRSGLGKLLSFKGLCDTSATSGLTFRPLSPQLKTKMYIIWKKYQVFSPIAERFVEQLQVDFAN
ncbi:LysR family transcriptional regulator [Lactiplantibacillus nangangensis]|uniref:LysR family transcriptional regulator n=1 Tax=Lactiplantibacillus nangangensis TaxID=2559917 RepID=A0ABW1SKW8_9LACO|nr:LysR family transcriptional regulator [Lactiplantibacillus nangangensis]